MFLELILSFVVLTYSQGFWVTLYEETNCKTESNHYYWIAENECIAIFGFSYILKVSDDKKTWSLSTYDGIDCSNTPSKKSGKLNSCLVNTFGQGFNLIGEYQETPRQHMDMYLESNYYKGNSCSEKNTLLASYSEVGSCVPHKEEGKDTEYIKYVYDNLEQNLLKTVHSDSSCRSKVNEQTHIQLSCINDYYGLEESFNHYLTSKTEKVLKKQVSIWDIFVLYFIDRLYIYLLVTLCFCIFCVFPTAIVSLYLFYKNKIDALTKKLRNPKDVVINEYGRFGGEDDSKAPLMSDDDL